MDSSIPGNVIAALSWLILSALFSWYIGHFGNYDATYGLLGAAIGNGTVHGLTLDLNGFVMQANLLVHRRFDNIAPYPHSTMAHISLADTKLFFANWDHLLSAGKLRCHTGASAVLDGETAPKSVWEATLAAVEDAAPSPG